ncbi:MAG: hypothetical protein AMXMBFR33_07220 [Candidatus Xenobia bacterium]|jgi:hypothetical protein
MSTIGWLDITVEDATTLRDFYAEVVGWKAEGLSMGDYDDYVMQDPQGQGVAGICHARGSNAELPPMWIPYFVVSDLDQSLEAARRRGGELIGGVRGAAGQDRFAVVRDPAGAVAALYQKA